MNQLALCDGDITVNPRHALKRLIENKDINEASSTCYSLSKAYSNVYGDKLGSGIDNECAQIIDEMKGPGNSCYMKRPAPPPLFGQYRREFPLLFKESLSYRDSLNTCVENCETALYPNTCVDDCRLDASAISKSVHKYDSLKKNSGVIVLSVCTDKSPELNNFIKSLDKFGYDYKILGLGEKWGGWPWRTQMYLKELNAIEDDSLVILCDATDILFIRPPEVFAEKMAGLEKVLVGAESQCCTGKYSNTCAREKVVEESRKSVNHRNRFPNGGFLAGTALKLRSLLKDNVTEVDDQAGLLTKIVNGDQRMHLDTNSVVIGNINKLREGYRVYDDPEAIDFVDSELFLWDHDPSLNIFISKKSGEAPVALHFPGSNTKSYNQCGELLMKESFTLSNPAVAATPQKNNKNKILFAKAILMLVLVTLLLTMMLEFILRRIKKCA